MITSFQPKLPLRMCDACEHKKRPDGGWCYMFRTEPQTSYCAQFTIAKAQKGGDGH